MTANINCDICGNLLADDEDENACDNCGQIYCSLCMSDEEGVCCECEIEEEKDDSEDDDDDEDSDD